MADYFINSSVIHFWVLDFEGDFSIIEHFVLVAISVFQEARASFFLFRACSISAANTTRQAPSKRRIPAKMLKWVLSSILCSSPCSQSPPAPPPPRLGVDAIRDRYFSANFVLQEDGSFAGWKKVKKPSKMYFALRNISCLSPASKV